MYDTIRHTIAKNINVNLIKHQDLTPSLKKIRGTEEVSPHGIPADFLDRLMIIRTTEYSEGLLYEP